jgi:hypothetical protein
MNEEQIIEIVKQILQPPVLLAVAGAVLSLLAAYVPRFREWFAALTPSRQAFGMFITITSLSILIGIVSWTGFIVIVEPTKGGLIVLIFSWLSGLWANQNTYPLIKNSLPASVMAIKLKNK